MYTTTPNSTLRSLVEQWQAAADDEDSELDAETMISELNETIRT